MELNLAKLLLDSNDCTLVIVHPECVKVCYNRGVMDLVNILDEEPEILKGANIADKIIGKAAAALMIEGEVAKVFTRVITTDALSMFNTSNIPIEFIEEVSIVQNRTKTGRCPLDTICAPMHNIKEMTNAIKEFVKNQK